MKTNIESEIKRLGYVECDGFTVRICESDIFAGRFDVIKMVNGVRSFISGILTPLPSLAAAQAFAVVIALGFVPAEEVKQPTASLVSKQVTKSVCVPTRPKPVDDFCGMSWEDLERMQGSKIKRDLIA